MTLPARLLAKGAVATLLISLGTITAGSGVALAVAGAAPITHGITTFAGTGTAGYNGDNQVAANAELNNPAGEAEDLTGAVYIADSGNNRVRKVTNPTTTDQISTVAGNGMPGYSQNGTLATAAMLKDPSAVSVQDQNGNILIADTGNNVIRLVAASTGTFYGQSMVAGHIYTIAGDTTGCPVGKKPPAPMGNGVMGTSGSVCAPTGVADSPADGGFFFSDTGHNIVYRENKNGTISPYAGKGACQFSGDGGKGTMAQLCMPNGLAVDNGNNLYIADTGNSRVREVAQNGNISTVAGNGKPGYSGEGSATKVELNDPTGVGVDSMHNVYISDTLNQRIRKVAGGQITTWAGTGVAGFSGDAGSSAPADATQSEINMPTGSIAVDSMAVYFSDQGNQRARLVFNGPAPVLPETNLLILLPIGTGLILAVGTGIVIFRRHRRHVAPTAAV
jgi:sugar lactone lactonase YvrE